MEGKKLGKILKNNLIYIEITIYAILAIFVIYLSIYGPLEVKIFPIAFLLGIIGTIVFDRPIIISFICFCISLCEVQILGNYSFQYNLIYSLYNFICILLGGMAGNYILNIIHSRATKITHKVAHNISFAVLTTFLSIFFNQYMNGDIIGYIKAKDSLKKYITTEYAVESDKLKIVDAKFLSGDLNYYSFKVSGIDKISPDKKYKMSVYLNNKIIDGYYESRIKEMTDELSSKFKFKYSDLNFNDCLVDMYYTDLNGTITLKCSKTVNKITEQSIDLFCRQINQILKSIVDFEHFNNIYKINAVLKSEEEASTANIYITDFFNVEKYKLSFDTEFFDV